MSRIFAVNILSDEQGTISERFAGRHQDKEANRFEGIEWQTLVTGAPTLPQSQACLDCRVTAAFDGGSHRLFLGDVVALRVDESKSPLIFFQSRYMGIDSMKLLQVPGK